MLLTLITVAFVDAAMKLLAIDSVFTALIVTFISSLFIIATLLPKLLNFAARRKKERYSLLHTAHQRVVSETVSTDMLKFCCTFPVLGVKKSKCCAL